jgi:hypothetical protein
MRIEGDGWSFDNCGFKLNQVPLAYIMYDGGLGGSTICSTISTVEPLIMRLKQGQ